MRGQLRLDLRTLRMMRFKMKVVDPLFMDDGWGGGSKPPNPTTQEEEKGKESVPKEGNSYQVHGFHVNYLFDGLSWYLVSRLSLHVPGLGDVQILDY